MPELRSKYMRSEVVTTGEIWLIRNIRHGSVLGCVEWYAAWRCFVFQPEDGCLFNDGCLESIRAFLADANAEHKAARDNDKKQIEALKKLYGFDKPAHVRYVEMLGNFLRFDLGRSFLQNKGVWELIKEKLPVSMSRTFAYSLSTGGVS